MSSSCSTDTRIHQFIGYRHHRYMDALYAFISCRISLLHVFTSIHACIVSIFLSYGSPLILHILLLHVYSFIPVTWFFLLLILIFPLLNTWAVDIRCVELGAMWIKATGATSWISHLLFLVILFYAINRAHVQLSCYMWCTVLVLATLCTV